MKKVKFISLVLSSVILFLSLTGCDYFWPNDGNNKIQLPIEVVAAKNKYYSEPVKLGTVEKSKKMDMSNYEGTEYFYCTAGLAELSLFGVGDKGRLIIDTSLPDDPNHGKVIEYKAKVNSIPSGQGGQYVVQITGAYDTKIVTADTTATFKVFDELKENVIAVPLSAVRFYNLIAIVGVLKNGTREDRVVKIGIIGDESVEIISGISVGENIVFQ